MTCRPPRPVPPPALSVALSVPLTLLLALAGHAGAQDQDVDTGSGGRTLDLGASRFPTLKRLAVGRAPHQIVFSADGTTAWIAVAGDDKVLPVDVATLTMGEALHSPGVPLGLALPEDDLRHAVARAMRDPQKEVEGVGRLYGMSANIPIKGMIDAFLKRYMDLLFKL